MSLERLEIQCQYVDPSGEGWDDCEDMAWTRPAFTRGEIDRAGEALIDNSLWVAEREATLRVINNWRSSHSYPLHALKMALRGRARKIDANAIVAQRLKRLESISIKLHRNANMKFSQMQDIGGCRAVVSNMDTLKKLIAKYEESIAKNPKTRAELVKAYDYIKIPKSDGYRSLHYVYKYRTASTTYQAWNGLRIEIQLRTRLQHAWATAVETVSTFTGQALKSNVGDTSWKRFFALMGSVIALKEECNPVPSTPSDLNVLVPELRDISQSLNVHNVLQGWGAAVGLVAERAENANIFLLVLNLRDRRIKIKGFQDNQLAQASEEYLSVEETNRDNPEMQTVLVSVDSVDALKEAYPNYYLDSDEFLKVLKEAVDTEV